MKGVILSLSLPLLCFSLLVQANGTADRNAVAGLEATALRGGGSGKVRSPSQIPRPSKTMIRQQTRAFKNLAAKSVLPSSKKDPLTVKPSTFSTFSEHKNVLAGVLFLTAVERGINKFFVAKSIAFPAQLAGCIGLFFALLLADVIKPGMGEAMYASLVPGSSLLAKWFPVLFVPGLVMLPLAPSIGNGVEVRREVTMDRRG